MARFNSQCGVDKENKANKGALALKWPSDKKAMEKILSEVERIKTLLNLAFSHDIRYVIDTID